MISARQLFFRESVTNRIFLIAISPYGNGTGDVVQLYCLATKDGKDESAAVDFGTKEGFALRTEPHQPSQQNTTAAISAAHAKPCK